MVLALEKIAGDFGEEPLDLVDPRQVGRREVPVEPRVFGQPGGHGRVLVGAILVADNVDVGVPGHVVIDRGQELLQLRGRVPPAGESDHRAVLDVHRREQARGAVSEVVVGALLGHAEQSLHLGSLVA